MLTNARLSLKSQNLIFPLRFVCTMQTCSMWNHWDFTQEKHFLKWKYCLHFECTAQQQQQWKKKSCKISHFYCFKNTWAEDTAIASWYISLWIDLEGSLPSLFLLIFVCFALISNVNSTTTIALYHQIQRIVCTILLRLCISIWSFRMFIKSFAEHIQLSMKKKKKLNICRRLCCCDYPIKMRQHRAKEHLVSSILLFFDEQHFSLNIFTYKQIEIRIVN